MLYYEDEGYKENTKENLSIGKDFEPIEVNFYESRLRKMT